MLKYFWNNGICNLGKYLNFFYCVIIFILTHFRYVSKSLIFHFNVSSKISIVIFSYLMNYSEVCCLASECVQIFPDEFWPAVSSFMLVGQEAYILIWFTGFWTCRGHSTARSWPMAGVSDAADGPWCPVPLCPWWALDRCYLSCLEGSGVFKWSWVYAFPFSFYESLFHSFWSSIFFSFCVCAHTQV